MTEDLADLYDQHVSGVYGYLAYRLGSRAEAERLTEATFNRVLKGTEAPSPGDTQTRVWLLRIAREVGHRQRRPAPTEAEDLGISPALARALDRLERHERSVLALFFGADLPGREIAAVMELEPTRVRRLLSQGIRRLRTELDREEGRSPAPEARSAAERRPDRGQDQQQDA